MRWEPQSGATPTKTNPPRGGDLALGHGQYGHYLLYADRNSIDRFRSFVFAIARATSPSASMASPGSTTAISATTATRIPNTDIVVPN